MFEISLSPSNLLAHGYLSHLVEARQLGQFSLSAGQIICQQLWQQSQTTAKVGHKLVVFAEGLNLQALLTAEQELAAHLSVHHWQVVKVPGLQGFALSASIELHNHANLNASLERVASQYCIELCVVADKPSLQQTGLLVMDMDSTVIACECIDDIATLAGVGEQVSAVTAQAMQGKLDFAQSLRTRVGCLAGADEAILQQVKHALPLMPGIANLVALLKQHDWKLAIASGGFTYFADYLADRLSLDAALANKLEIIDGKLTGKVDGDIVDAQVKAQTLVQLAERWGIPLSQTIAMGDGANDLVMMKAAALGVAFHAKPVVRQQADVAIRRGGLDALLWILAA